MDTLASFLSYGVLAPLGVIGVFFVLVCIHELGHFAVGRYFGVDVEEFALGFGPILFARTDRYGTRWAWRALPLGGFVKFAGDADATSRPARPARPAPNPQDQSAMDARVTALATLALWKRALVVAAGPIANLILAFVLFLAHAMILGTTRVDPLIGSVVPGSPADMAGLQVGDAFVSVAGRQVVHYTDADLAFEANLGRDIAIIVMRDGQERRLNLTPTPGSEAAGTFGTSASGLAPQIKLRVLQIVPESPAERMGLQVDDLVVGYNDQPLTSPQAFAAARLASVGADMRLRVQRGGEELVLVGQPELQPSSSTGEAGQAALRATFGFRPAIDAQRVRLGLLPAAHNAAKSMRQFSTLIFSLPGQFVRGERSLDDLGGPVRIAEEVGTVVVLATAQIILLGALLSLQLGILNLLPIPILDGGHLLLYAAEALWRRPLPPILTDWLYRVGGAVLITFFVLVTFNDLQRLILG